MLIAAHQVAVKTFKEDTTDSSEFLKEANVMKKVLDLCIDNREIYAVRICFVLFTSPLSCHSLSLSFSLFLSLFPIASNADEASESRAATCSVHTGQAHVYYHRVHVQW